MKKVVIIYFNIFHIDENGIDNDHADWIDLILIKE